jgi:hypothetical protein
MYAPIPEIELARSLELIVAAIEPLAGEESVEYLSVEGSIEINRSFAIVPQLLTDILVKESLKSEAEMILKVKRPDFLGDARWEFRHGKQTIEAKVLDTKWLAEFRSGNVLLIPRDALRVIVLSLVRYGHDGELVDTKHEILKVTRKNSDGAKFTGKDYFCLDV